MQTKEFIKNILATNNLELIEETKEVFIILNKNSQQRYEVDKSQLIQNDWANTRRVLNGGGKRGC